VSWATINAVACGAFALGWVSSFGLMFLFDILDLHWLNKWLESRAECRRLEQRVEHLQAIVQGEERGPYR